MGIDLPEPIWGTSPVAPPAPPTPSLDAGVPVPATSGSAVFLEGVKRFDRLLLFRDVVGVEEGQVPHQAAGQLRPLLHGEVPAGDAGGGQAEQGASNLGQGNNSAPVTDNLRRESM